jgi:hypothetical protein
LAFGKEYGEDCEIPPISELSTTRDENAPIYLYDGQNSEFEARRHIIKLRKEIDNAQGTAKTKLQTQLNSYYKTWASLRLMKNREEYFDRVDKLHGDGLETNETNQPARIRKGGNHPRDTIAQFIRNQENSPPADGVTAARSYVPLVLEYLRSGRRAKMNLASSEEAAYPSCSSDLRFNNETIDDKGAKFEKAQRQYKCKICHGKVYKRSGNLTRHYEDHHPDLILNKLLPAIPHDDDKPRPVKQASCQLHCPLCARKFTNLRKLTTHINLHLTGSRKISFTGLVPCRACTITFSNKWECLEHLAMFHIQGVCYCPICGLLCRNNNGVDRHIRLTHPGRLPSSCEMCKYAGMSVDGDWKGHLFEFHRPLDLDKRSKSSSTQAKHAFAWQEILTPATSDFPGAKKEFETPTSPLSESGSSIFSSYGLISNSPGSPISNQMDFSVEFDSAVGKIESNASNIEYVDSGLDLTYKQSSPINPCLYSNDVTATYIRDEGVPISQLQGCARTGSGSSRQEYSMTGFPDCNQHTPSERIGPGSGIECLSIVQSQLHQMDSSFGKTPQPEVETLPGCDEPESTVLSMPVLGYSASYGIDLSDVYKSPENEIIDLVEVAQIPSKDVTGLVDPELRPTVLVISSETQFQAEAESQNLGGDIAETQPTTNDTDEYTADCIVAKWGGLFLVQWPGKKCKSYSVEPRKNILDKSLIDDFVARNGTKGIPKNAVVGCLAVRTRKKTREYKLKLIGIDVPYWVRENQISGDLIRQFKFGRR